MPRVRGPEMAQRVSTRAPAPLRTSSSDSDPLHHRPMTDRSPKLGDRRSPRSVHSEPLNQKKLGTRIAGLETQLEQAQGELKVLKDQLASAEAAKKEAQKELEKRTTKPPPVAVIEPETRSSPSETQDSNKEIRQEDETPDENQKETDVFEVPIETVTQTSDQNDVKTKESENIPDSQEKPGSDEVLTALTVRNEEVSLLKLKIEEKEKELEAFRHENEGLKQQVIEANSNLFSAKEKEEKMSVKMTHLEEEFKQSKNDAIQLTQKLKEVEGAKEALETEMKKLRVQTEQWRKAADAAAAILSGGVEMNDGRRVSERCGSMDKHYGGVFDGYGGFVGSPGMGDDCDDGLGNGKRKGSGIRMFGDLWKKKGQK